MWTKLDFNTKPTKEMMKTHIPQGRATVAVTSVNVTLSLMGPWGLSSLRMPGKLGFRKLVSAGTIGRAGSPAQGKTEERVRFLPRERHQGSNFWRAGIRDNMVGQCTVITSATVSNRAMVIATHGYLR